jgi:hypothetical protein
MDNARASKRAEAVPAVQFCPTQSCRWVIKARGRKEAAGNYGGKLQHSAKIK